MYMNTPGWNPMAQPLNPQMQMRQRQMQQQQRPMQRPMPQPQGNAYGLQGRPMPQPQMGGMPNFQQMLQQFMQKFMANFQQQFQQQFEQEFPQFRQQESPQVDPQSDPNMMTTMNEKDRFGNNAPFGIDPNTGRALTQPNQPQLLQPQQNGIPSYRPSVEEWKASQGQTGGYWDATQERPQAPAYPQGTLTSWQNQQNQQNRPTPNFQQINEKRGMMGLDALKNDSPDLYGSNQTF